MTVEGAVYALLAVLALMALAIYRVSVAIGLVARALKKTR